MIVDQESDQNTETLQKKEQALMVAQNKNFSENKDNVLFQPAGSSDVPDFSASVE